MIPNQIHRVEYRAHPAIREWKILGYVYSSYHDACMLMQNETLPGCGRIYSYDTIACRKGQTIHASVGPLDGYSGVTVSW